MKNISLFLGRFIVPVFAMAMIFAGCDSSNGFEASEFESEDIEQTVAFLAQDLGLTASETQALSVAFAKHEGGSHEPGFLWRVAADLQSTLTDEQKQKLFDRFENMGDAPGAGIGQGGQGQGGFGQRGQDRGHMGQAGRGQGHFGGAIELTDDQQQQIQDIRDAHAEEIKTLMDARRDGSISVDNFHTQMEALRDAIKLEIDAVLTDEQREQLEELKAQREADRADREAQREANREAGRAVMIEVLGLSDEQVTFLDDMHADREALQAAVRELIENGASREEIQEMLEDARADFETFASILGETQLEIFMIHAVLAKRMNHRRGQNGQGGPGFGQRQRRSRG